MKESIKVILFSILVLSISCKSSKNKSPCDINVKSVQNELVNNPDSLAFYLKCYVYEVDGTLSERRIFVLTKDRPVSRIKTEDGYESMLKTFPGIVPHFELKGKGYFEMNLLQENEFKIRISPFKIVNIKPQIGKKLTLEIHLKDYSSSDCLNYIRATTD